MKRQDVEEKLIKNYNLEKEEKWPVYSEFQ